MTSSKSRIIYIFEITDIIHFFIKGREDDEFSGNGEKLLFKIHRIQR